MEENTKEGYCNFFVTMLKIIPIIFFILVFNNFAYPEKIKTNVSVETEDWETQVSKKETPLKIEGQVILDYYHPFGNTNYELDPFNKFFKNSNIKKDTYRNILNPSLKYNSSGKEVNLYVNDFFVSSIQENQSLSGVNRDNFNNILTECYGKYKTDNFNFMIGKINIAEGTGYFTNPTDYLGKTTNITGGNIDSKRRIATREGDILGGIERQSDNVLFSVKYIPKLNNTESFDWGTNKEHKIHSKISAFAFNSDINFIVLQTFDQDERAYVNDSSFPRTQSKNSTKAGSSFSYVIGESLEVHAELSYRHDRSMPHVSQSEITAGPSTYTYQRWDESKKKNLTQCLAGSQYTFAKDTLFENMNIIVEYYYQNEGWTNSEWDMYFNALDSMRNMSQSNPVYLYNLRTAKQNLDLLESKRSLWGRHYLFYRLSKEITNWFEFAIFQIFSLQDKSSNVSVNISKKFGKYIVADFFASSNLGKDESEFGRLPVLNYFQLSISGYF